MGVPKNDLSQNDAFQIFSIFTQNNLPQTIFHIPLFFFLGGGGEGGGG